MSRSVVSEAEEERGRRKEGMRVILMTNRLRLSTAARMQMRGGEQKKQILKKEYSAVVANPLFTIKHAAKSERARQEAVNVVFASKPPFKITKMLEMAPTDGRQGEVEGRNHCPFSPVF